MPDVSKDPVLVLLRGHPTRIPPAKQPIAMAGDEEVYGVAQRSGYDPEYSHERPGKAEPFIDAEDGVAVPTHLVSLDNEQASGVVGIHPVPAVEGLPDLALHGGETK